MFDEVGLIEAFEGLLCTLDLLHLCRIKVCVVSIIQLLICLVHDYIVGEGVHELTPVHLLYIKGLEDVEHLQLYVFAEEICLAHGLPILLLLDLSASSRLIKLKRSKLLLFPWIEDQLLLRPQLEGIRPSSLGSQITMAGFRTPFLSPAAPNAF